MFLQNSHQVLMRGKNRKASSNAMRVKKSESAFSANECVAHSRAWRSIWWNPLSNTHSIISFSFSVSLSLWIDCISGVPLRRIWFKVLAVRMHPLPNKQKKTKQKDKHKELQEIPHYIVPDICVRAVVHVGCLTFFRVFAPTARNLWINASVINPFVFCFPIRCDTHTTTTQSIE